MKKGKNDNLPTCNSLLIEFENIDSSLIESFIFKSYMKASLIDKGQISNNEEIELEIMKEKYKVKVFVKDEAQSEQVGKIKYSITINTEISILSLDLLSSNQNTKYKDEYRKFIISKIQQYVIEYKAEGKIEDNFYVETVHHLEIINALKLAFNNNNSIIDKDNIPNSFIYKGLVVSGESGFGKTTSIIQAIRYYSNDNKDVNISLLQLNSFDNIKNLFKYAKIIKNAIIFIPSVLTTTFTHNTKNDEDQGGSSDSNNDSVNLLIKQIDQITETDRVFTILEINSPIDDLDSKLKLGGRFDINVNIASADLTFRKKLLSKYLEILKYDMNINLERICDKMQGFSPSDIISVCKVAMYKADNNILDQYYFDEALNSVKPINLKDIIVDVPKTYWSDIGGNKDIINKIRQSIEWPIKNPNAFIRLGITPPNGILLYGPPGCSKTLIAKALATESGLSFLAVKGPELFSKYVGDSEKAIRNIFKKARMCAPSIIFFDEIDSMAEQRGSDSHVSDKVLCQLLNELDGIEGRKQVVIVGATNRPDILDKALIRPGRFDRLLYIPPPDKEARLEIIKINLTKLKVEEGVSIENLADLTNGFSGAEINMVLRESGMICLNEDINSENIKEKHILEAIKAVKPIITKEMISYYENFAIKNKEE